MGARFSAGDATVLAALLVFALLAIALHNSIAGLGEMARGVGDAGVAIRETGRETAGEIRRSGGAVAGAAESVPLAGGQVADAIRSTADRSADSVERETRASGAQLIAAGRSGESDAESTARLVGVLAFVIPAMLLLFQWVPRRWDAWQTPPARRREPEPAARAARR